MLVQTKTNSLSITNNQIEQLYSQQIASGKPFIASIGEATQNGVVPCVVAQGQKNSSNNVTAAALGWTTTLTRMIQNFSKELNIQAGSFVEDVLSQNDFQLEEGSMLFIQKVDSLVPMWDGHNPLQKGSDGPICTVNGQPVYRYQRLQVGSKIEHLTEKYDSDSQVTM